MVAFNKKTEGGKQVSTHLSPRGNRTSSGQVHSAWVGVSAPQNAPTSLSATPVNTSVSISFTAPTDNGGMDITNYQYAISSNGGSSYSAYAALSPADAISPITVSGLTQNTAYLIKLKAVNDVGVSDIESSPVSLTTEGIPTGTPTITSVTVGTTTATVNYTYPGGGGAVTGWDLYVTNQTNSWNNTTASPISVTGLTPNTLYTFYVRAKNAYGVGPQSTGVNATTNPTFISASGGATLDYASGGFTYRSHTFTGNGTFTVSSAGSFGVVDVHLVGGGGGGGWSYGGGGGGGGGRTQTSVGIAATSYGVVVGGAGSNTFGSPYTGVAGGTSTVMGFSAGGGGGGSSNVTGPTATPENGSGGGGNLNQIAAGAGTSYGSAGTGPSNGGGSGGSGFNQPNNYRTGSNETYAVGGGGSGYSFGGSAGTTYGCGGGGGGNYDQVNRFGGAPVAGVVIIRYRIA